MAMPPRMLPTATPTLHEKDRQRQTGHRALTGDRRAARPTRSAHRTGNDGTRAPRWSNWNDEPLPPGPDAPTTTQSARVQLGTPGDAPALWSLIRGHLTCVITTLLALLRRPGRNVSKGRNHAFHSLGPA